jgi:hypothetical protein
VLLSCAALALLLSGAGAHAAQTLSASQLLNAALRDARARGSAHEVEQWLTSKASGTYSDDVGLSEGRQQIQISGGVRAHTLILDGTAYTSGNQAAFVQFFGFPAAVARTIGTRWVSTPRSDTAYATVARDATLPSALADVTPSGHLTETADQRSWVGAIAITGANSLFGPGTFTLYVSRSSTPLPLGATFSGTKVMTATFVFSDWGEALALKAPANAIPISKLER